MPAAGKSTIGVVLAKRLGLAFLDTDVAIQTAEHRSLQDIIDRDGIDAFRALEERYVLTLEPRATVIATGGSVVYSEPAVHHLRRLGIVVHLDAGLDELRARLNDLSGRGLVRRPGQSLTDLHAERLPLYRAAADITVVCDGLSPAAIVERVAAALDTVRP